MMKKENHIVMLLEHTYPPDIRVEKEITSLIKNKYKISILCHQSQTVQNDEIVNKATVYRRINPTFNNRLYSKIHMGFNFIHPYFLKNLKKLFNENPFDAIHVHDLPLAKTALHFKQKYN